jgi:4-hydroxy-3-polyprenylbenzoate decarboxylase
LTSDLQSFLARLESAGELHRVSCEVSPLLEISAIADRVSKGPCAGTSRAAEEFDPLHASLGGKALLFENVADSDFPLCINVFGSYRRMEMALGCDRDPGGFESIAQRIASLTKPSPPRSFGEMLRKAREFLPLLRIPPRMIRRGLCQEVVKLTSRNEVDLTRLPLIKCWPLDGDPRAVGWEVSPEEAGTSGGAGRYITFAGMHTIHFDDRDDPKPASHNIGMYRAQLIDRTHLAMHWHMHHDGAAHWRSWKKAGQPMPIAIALGGESVLPYAATAPLPPGISELLVAGFLNGRGIPMVRCKTVPLRVPANSEIVIEGWVSTGCGGPGVSPGRVIASDIDATMGTRTGETPVPPDQLALSQLDLGPGAVFEGPFGDHTGYYSMPDRYPIVEVSAITHRRNAVYPTTIVGLPPQEDYYMGKATERIFLPLLKTIIHDIDDYHLPQFGCFHNCAFVRIHKAYPLQARRVMHAIWGAGQMAWTKFIVVVDDDVNVHDEEAVLRAMFAHCHFGRDIEVVNGPLDILDHAAPRLGAGCKMGFDATRKISGEEVNGIAVSAETRRSSTPTDCHPWALSPNAHAPRLGGGRCVFVKIEKQRAGAGARAIDALWRAAPEGSADFVVALDGPMVDLRDWQRVFFHLCANVDPGRDLHIEKRGSDPISATGRIAFDATRKLPGDERHGQPVRDYPPIIEMDAQTNALIDRRWHEYGF